MLAKSAKFIEDVYKRQEKCFMRFEGYRNKAVVIETPIEHQELIENNIDTEPILSLIHI